MALPARCLRISDQATTQEGEQEKKRHLVRIRQHQTCFPKNILGKQGERLLPPKRVEIAVCDRKLK